jgi:hypothetical protein
MWVFAISAAVRWTLIRLLWLGREKSMIPLNYTADSRKPIAIPVDLKPRHRDSDMAHIAADSTWLKRRRKAFSPS